MCMEGKIRIMLENTADLWVMHLAGRFVTGSDEEYRRTKKEVEEKGIRVVVADCRELPYVDSTGLSFMIGMYKTLRNSRGLLVLANANRRVKEVLRITHLDGFLPVFETVEDALEALASSRMKSQVLIPLPLTA